MALGAHYAHVERDLFVMALGKHAAQPGLIPVHVDGQKQSLGASLRCASPQVWWQFGVGRQGRDGFADFFASVAVKHPDLVDRRVVNGGDRHCDDVGWGDYVPVFPPFVAEPATPAQARHSEGPVNAGGIHQ